MVLAASVNPTSSIELHLVRIQADGGDEHRQSIDGLLIFATYSTMGVLVFIGQMVLLKARCVRNKMRAFMLVTMGSFLITAMAIAVTCFFTAPDTVLAFGLTYIVANNVFNAFLSSPMICEICYLMEEGNEGLAINLLSGIYNLVAMVSRGAVVLEDRLFGAHLVHLGVPEFRIPSLINLGMCLIVLGLYLKLVKHN